MANTIKATFTFDQATINRLDEAAERLSKPKSEIVREAINEYHQRIDRLSEAERVRMLRAIDEYAKLPQTRSRGEMEAELKELRAVRRLGGRRHRY
jgi:predicted DNA-binding protein